MNRARTYVIQGPIAGLYRLYADDGDLLAELPTLVEVYELIEVWEQRDAKLYAKLYRRSQDE